MCGSAKSAQTVAVRGSRDPSLDRNGGGEGGEVVPIRQKAAHQILLLKRPSATKLGRPLWSHVHVVVELPPPHQLTLTPHRADPPADLPTRGIPVT